MSSPQRIALAYSGGLDTSVIIPWLLENHPGSEVLAVVGDVGQDRSELVGIEEKALASGDGLRGRRSPNRVPRGLRLSDGDLGCGLRRALPAGHVDRPTDRRAQVEFAVDTGATPSPMAAPGRGTTRSASRRPSPPSPRSRGHRPGGPGIRSRDAPTTSTREHPTAAPAGRRSGPGTRTSGTSVTKAACWRSLERPSTDVGPDRRPARRSGGSGQRRRLQVRHAGQPRRRADGGPPGEPQRARRIPRRRTNRHRRESPGRHEEPRMLRDARRHDPHGGASRPRGTGARSRHHPTATEAGPRLHRSGVRRWMVDSGPGGDAVRLRDDRSATRRRGRGHGLPRPRDHHPTTQSVLHVLRGLRDLRDRRCVRPVARGGLHPAPRCRVASPR